MLEKQEIDTEKCTLRS